MSTWRTDGCAFASVAFDPQGIIVDINAAALEIVGSTRENAIGLNLRDILTDESRQMVQESFESALKGTASQVRAVGVRFPGGENLPLDIVYLSLEQDAAALIALIQPGSRVRASGEALTSRENFQLLFERNPTVVIAVDAEQRISDINRAGLQLSGYSREQVVGQDIGVFVPPTQRDALRAVFHRAMSGQTVRFRTDSYAADGRLIEYSGTAIPTIAHNRITGVYGMLENVTDRLRAERTVLAQREELIDLEHDFRSLFDRNPDGVCLLSTDGAILDINEAVTTMSSRAREEIVGQNFRVFLQGGDLERGWSFFRRAIDGETVRYEISSQRGDGRDLIIDVTTFPKYAQGVVVGAYSAMQDITERKIAQRKSEMQAQRIRDLYLLATTPEYTDGQVMSTLQTGCRLLGMESGAIVDTVEAPRVEMRYDSLELFAGNDDLVVDLARQTLTRREMVVAQAQAPSDSGYGTWIASKLTSGTGSLGVLLFFSRVQREEPFEEIDIDTLALMAALVGAAMERRRTRSHLRTLAYYDALTGLPNRLYFQERLRDALVNAKGHAASLAVLFFDLDRFKDINDSLGHAMGDRFLQMVAHRLVLAVGEGGLVARMGGDEFIILLYDGRDVSEVQDTAAQLLKAVDQPYRLDDYEQFMTTSIGISRYPDDGRDDQTLIKNADIAMYRAKDRGGNSYFTYSSALNAPLRTRLAQEKLLRRALERDEFAVHFQPIIDIASGQVVCVEALVRWQDPQRGLIYPDDFIPTAEASGLIVQLGEWVLSQSASQVVRWQELLGPIALAVNISARQFAQPGLCGRIIDLLALNGFDPACLEVEITESMALADVSHAVDTVRRLKHIGARIAVDDFGTGHSSLNYLRRFDVDLIKIDRSFVAGIGLERSDETIVKAMIAMGHSLGLKIVAEGVETQEQYAFLQEQRCDRVQGYLFSRPLDAQGLERYILSRGSAVPKT